MRKIIHVDMDAFFASVEQRDNPAYRGKPLIVGGSPRDRGVVAAASYEARRYGIRSAMPAARAQALCPDAIFVRPRFDAYRAASRQIHAIFNDYTALIEPLSLDEAYLDMTDALDGGSATRAAAELRRRIARETGLTASAGVSYNKFLAKLASDINKPDGQYVIAPAQGPAFVAALPVGRFHGIGRATEARLRELGVRTGADLRARSLAELVDRFGKLGRRYHELARGVDQRPVQPERTRQSLSTETTFSRDVRDRAGMLETLYRLADEVGDCLTRRTLWAQTLTVKVKYGDFTLVTRSQTLSAPFQTLTPPLKPLLGELLARTDAGARSVRLLGVGASNFVDADVQRSQQLCLF